MMKTATPIGYTTVEMTREANSLRVDGYNVRPADRIVLEEQMGKFLSLEEKLEKILAEKWRTDPLSFGAKKAMGTPGITHAEYAW
jgi:hypothetical protein